MSDMWVFEQRAFLQTQCSCFYCHY